MMKKRFVLCKILLILILFYSGSSTGAGDLPDIKAESAILINGMTGKIFYQKNSNSVNQPASLTKIMTEYLVLEAIKQGYIGWEDKVPVSDYAYRISKDWKLSNFSLEKGRAYSVKELFEAVAVYSANSAAIALAEYISGSEAGFVKKMNIKAEELGLKDFKFFDCTGLSNGNIKLEIPYSGEGNLIPAFAVAKLAFYLINDYPEILKFSRIRRKSFYVNEESMINMVNWNWMLPGFRFGYTGVDGLKTGHTSSAGYCFAATARQNGLRLISVVMKAKSRNECFEDTENLLDYGFNNFTRKKFFPPGYQAVLPVYNGEKEMVRAVTKESLEQLIKNGEEKLYSIFYELNVPHVSGNAGLAAPLEKGQFVGFLKLKYAGSEKYEYILPEGGRYEEVELFSAENIKEASWYTVLRKKIKKLFSN